MHGIQKTTWVVLIAVSLLGCRHGGPESDIMERELRVHEDKIYELEDHLDQYEALLDSCRRENRALKRRLGQDDKSDNDLPTPRGGMPRSRDPLETPEIEGVPNIEFEGASPSESSSFYDPDFDPEVLETIPAPLSSYLESGSDSSRTDWNQEIEFESRRPSREQTGSSLRLSDIFSNNRNGLFATDDSPKTYSDKPVARIELNKMVSGALNADGRLGDEGILAVVEPRDAEGQLVQANGELSLMILDPMRAAGKAEVARWDFDSGELDRYWSKTFMGEGYLFELPWPGEIPLGDGLQLWARLVTPEGKKYLTHLDIDITPGGATRPPIGQFRRVERWTARTQEQADCEEFLDGQDCDERAPQVASGPNRESVLAPENQSAVKPQLLSEIEPDGLLIDSLKQNATQALIERPIEKSKNTPGTKKPKLAAPNPSELKAKAPMPVTLNSTVPKPMKPVEATPPPVRKNPSWSPERD